MLKRTKGRLLLTLLVITGLAGTLKNSSISKAERKIALNELKDTRADVLKSIRNLSANQFNFKTTPGKWSVKECMYHIASSEKNLWDLLDAAMKAPSNPEKRKEIKITDEQLIEMMQDRTTDMKALELSDIKKAPYKTLQNALESFKTRRADHIKYMRTSTEDLRDHIVQLPFGWIDCYQLCLVVAAHSNRHLQQIEEIKSNPKFPK